MKKISYIALIGCILVSCSKKDVNKDYKKPYEKIEGQWSVLSDVCRTVYKSPDSTDKVFELYFASGCTFTFTFNYPDVSKNDEIVVDAVDQYGGLYNNSLAYSINRDSIWTNFYSMDISKRGYTYTGTLFAFVGAINYATEDSLIITGRATHNLEDDPIAYQDHIITLKR